MYVSKFRTDTAYGVEDINEITKILTGSGVSPVTPNDVLSAIAESGEVISDEKCAVSFADASKKTVRIGSGTVIMPDGSYIVVSGGEVLEIPDGAGKAYVLIRHDELEQNVPACTEQANTDSDVLLATVEGGAVYDARHYAKSKIEAYGSNSSKLVIYSGEQLLNLEAVSPGYEDSARILPLLSDAKYNYIIITMPRKGKNAVVVKLPDGQENAEVLSDCNEYIGGSTSYVRFSVNDDGQLLLSPYRKSNLNNDLHALYV